MPIRENNNILSNLDKSIKNFTQAIACCEWL